MSLSSSIGVPSVAASIATGVRVAVIVLVVSVIMVPSDAVSLAVVGPSVVCRGTFVLVVTCASAVVCRTPLMAEWRICLCILSVWW